MHAGTTVGRRFTLLHSGAHDLPEVVRWVAQDERLAQRVYLDIVVGSHADEARRVAALSAKVRDARFPRVLSSGVHVDDDGRHTYIVTERPRGKDATALLDVAPLAPAAAATLVGEASRALEVAAAAGLHHGAVRAAALTVTPAGRVLVTGLGVDGVLARPADASSAHEADEASDVAALVDLYTHLVTGHEAQTLTAAQVPHDLGTAGTALVHGAIAADYPSSLAHVSRALGSADARALRAATVMSRHAPESPAFPGDDAQGSDAPDDAQHDDDAPSVATTPAPPAGTSAVSASAPASPASPVTPASPPSPASAPSAASAESANNAAPPALVIPVPAASSLAAAQDAADQARAAHLLSGDGTLDEVVADLRALAASIKHEVNDVQDDPIGVFGEIVEHQARRGSLWQSILERIHRRWPQSSAMAEALNRTRELARRPAPFNVGPLVLGIGIVVIIVATIVALARLTTVTLPEGYVPGPSGYEYPEFTHAPSPSPSNSEGG